MKSLAVTLNLGHVINYFTGQVFFSLQHKNRKINFTVFREVNGNCFEIFIGQVNNYI